MLKVGSLYKIKGHLWLGKSLDSRPAGTWWREYANIGDYILIIKKESFPDGGFMITSLIDNTILRRTLYKNLLFIFEEIKND